MSSGDPPLQPNLSSPKKRLSAIITCARLLGLNPNRETLAKIVSPAAIECGTTAVLKGYNTLIQEEKNYRPRTLVKWLFCFVREYLHDVTELHPIYGVLLARIYYGSWKYSSRVGILEVTFYHIELATLTQVVRKLYRYGKTQLTLSRYYTELSKGKKTPRKVNPSLESYISLLLWLIKAIPYALGRLIASTSMR